ncbi:Zinc finger protein 772 [Tupaia chinensis]|uniref:Zinc finger protein 772 n=1 Tax=Tupaia chinensis TaxID=246437 RepID=L8YET5_TUPCH|nr:Zinc finger protein 772 [Tupaia chinensis]
MTRRRSGPGVEEEGTPFQQAIFGRGLQMRNLEAVPCTQEAHPYDMCNPVTKDILHLAEHHRTPTGQQPSIYRSCGRDFDFNVSLDQIQRQQSGVKFSRMAMGQTSFVKSYSCHMSEEDFLANSGIVQHQITHNGERPHRSTEYVEAIHTGQGVYKCSHCLKAFSNMDTLVQHQKIHSREKLYECRECGISFSHSSYLISHQKIHSTVTHKCNDCGQFFNDNSSLFLHQRIHTGSKSYECAQCGRSFSRKFSLAQHHVTHTGAKPFECNECGKIFGRKDKLIQHQKIHSGKRPYVCGRCGKTFIRKDGLMGHLKTHNKAVF